MSDCAILRIWPVRLHKSLVIVGVTHSTIAKYGINNADIYNFNETRFMMGHCNGFNKLRRACKSRKATAQQSGIGYSDPKELAMADDIDEQVAEHIRDILRLIVKVKVRPSVKPQVAMASDDQNG